MTDKQSVAALVAETVDEVKKAARVYVPVAIFHVRRQLARGGRDHADVHVLPEYAYALRLILQEEYGFQTSSVKDTKITFLAQASSQRASAAAIFSLTPLSHNLRQTIDTVE